MKLIFVSILCPAASLPDTDPPVLLQQAPVFASDGHIVEVRVVGWTIRVRMPLGARRFYPFQILHISPGAHLDSYTIGTGFLSQG
jgi:hypothetical protein